MNSSHFQSPELRIGAVSYLNTKPLVYGLADSLPHAELIFDYPSRLADALAEGELDIALVPVAETWAHPGWSLISNACIACHGPVLSVKLLFRVPPQQVRTLALDEGSRTSAVLAQILLKELEGVAPHLTSLPLGSEPADVIADAVLVIGDRAIRVDESEHSEIWDLGDRWCRATELPFVFAAWYARSGVETFDSAAALSTARDRGLAHLTEIAHEQAVAMKLPYDLVLEYLSRNLHFELGPRERSGLELFHAKAIEHKLVSPTSKMSCER